MEDCREFRTRCPEIYQVLIDCAAFVNWRRIEQGATHPCALVPLNQPTWRSG
jgi:hypothetical protein